jgi:hypothetical protein
MLRRLHRCPAKFAAALLALSVVAPRVAAAIPAASCCCKHHAQECHCPICDHGRELQSGQAYIKACAGGDQGAAVSSPVPVSLPPEQPATVVTSRPERAREATLAPESLRREVPTPPPLA